MMAWSTVFAVLTAIYQLFFAVFHLRFWKRYRWDFDLRHASEFTRKIIRILSVLLALQLTALAVVLLWFRDDVAVNPIGVGLLLQIALFWAARLVFHFVLFEGFQLKSVRWLSLFALGVVLPFACLLSAM